VVSATEGRIFHNRLTHTMKVAQVASRITQMLRGEQGDLASALGGIDPEVTEAAALAHDLGHPPFGHVAEHELACLVRAAGDDDAYEGNAQTLRIVASVENRWNDTPGLDLTRATLNATLKYPWFKASSGKRAHKYSAYRGTESEAFTFARALGPEDTKCAEAEIMDWADDITFSVHDMEDFFRAGLIPLDRLRSDDREFDWFLEDVKARWAADDKDLTNWAEFASAFDFLRQYFPERPYRDSHDDRADVRRLRSFLIQRYVVGPEDRRTFLLRHPDTLDGRTVEIATSMVQEVEILKELTWAYVIMHPTLAAQQQGNRVVVRTLFNYFHDAAHAKRARCIPAGHRHRLGTITPARLAADVVSSLTDREALHLFGRISGHAPGNFVSAPW